MQIVGYRASSGTLMLAQDGEPQPLALTPGTELSYALGERHCAGVLTADRHRFCENTDAPYCQLHDQTWICARCTGTCLKDEMDCTVPHAVYLAAFAPTTFKVGVTKRDRLTTRLKEQGADRAAHLETVADGRIARQHEADLATELTDRVRIDTKIAGLNRSVDASAWSSVLDRHSPIETFSFEYGLELERPPVRETILSGTVRGRKGRLVVLDRETETYVVDCRSLVGYELTRGRPDRPLQRSIGSF